MNEGSRRAQPSERRAALRVAPTRTQAEETRPVEPEPRQASHAPTSHSPRHGSSRPPRRFGLPIIVSAGIIALILLLVVGWFAWSNSRTVDAAIDTDKYQAVFFEGGQVYFGQLEETNDRYLTLTNVFYIQSSESTDQDVSVENPDQVTDSSMQLIKRGEEVFGPEDAMIINRDQVMFIENLKSDSRVSQLIQNYQSND